MWTYISCKLRSTNFVFWRIIHRLEQQAAKWPGESKFPQFYYFLLELQSWKQVVVAHSWAGVTIPRQTARQDLTEPDETVQSQARPCWGWKTVCRQARQCAGRQVRAEACETLWRHAWTCGRRWQGDTCSAKAGETMLRWARLLVHLLMNVLKVSWQDALLPLFHIRLVLKHFLFSR